MKPEGRSIWTRAEVRAGVGRIIAESLGVDAAEVTDDASLIRDLGAESIDFLDIAFSCQQTFGVDFSARLLQDQILQWRDLNVLARVIEVQHGVVVEADELRTVTPATPAAVLGHLAAAHGVARGEGDAEVLARTLAGELLAQLRALGIDVTGIDAETFAPALLDDLHSPVVNDLMIERFTVKAFTDYLAERLRAAGQLAADGQARASAAGA